MATASWREGRGTDLEKRRGQGERRRAGDRRNQRFAARQDRDDAAWVKAGSREDGARAPLRALPNQGLYFPSLNLTVIELGTSNP